MSLPSQLQRMKKIRTRRRSKIFSENALPTSSSMQCCKEKTTKCPLSISLTRPTCLQVPMAGASFAETLPISFAQKPSTQSAVRNARKSILWSVLPSTLPSIALCLTLQYLKKLRRLFKMPFLSFEVLLSFQLKVKRSPKVTSRSVIMLSEPKSLA